MKPIILESPEHAPKLKQWLETRGGIAVWVCQDLGSPRIGQETFTPAMHPDGSPATSPHWSNGNSPDRIVTDPVLVFVRSWTEVGRVKIRRGPPYLGGVHRRDRDRLDNALAKAGDGAAWIPDYSTRQYGSPWFTAIIQIPSAPIPLSQFQPA